MTTVRAVIFDYKTLFVADTNRAAEIAEMLQDIRDRGLLVCIFSTDQYDIENECRRRGLPPPDAYIHHGKIPSGKKRGSPDWITAAVDELRVETNELFYVGCTKLDWRTAINAAVLYSHAGWTGRQPVGTTSIVVDQPGSVVDFAELCLLVEPRWSYTYSDNTNRLEVRSLLPASASLPATPTSSFGLKDVFTYDRKPTVGISAQHSARDLLMIHVITSCYLEGLLDPQTYFCVYPSSKMRRVSEQLREYIEPASKLVHGFYKGDLLERFANATDTSLERYNAKRQGRQPNVSILTQANTVRVADSYLRKLNGRTVIVFDDFMTTGTSLSWAHLLLTNAGASKVILVSIGKYGGTRFTEARPAFAIDPTRAGNYKLQDFSTIETSLHFSPTAEHTLWSLLEPIASS